VGYRGKLAEQERARALRAQAWTLNEIAAELGVSKSSVSLWVRDVGFDEATRAARAGANRNRGAQARRPSRLRVEKEVEIERLLAEGRARIGELSEREFLVAGSALYAGEGAKADGVVKFANSDPRMIRFFCDWLRHFFAVDEFRLRVYLYLHAGLDLDAAVAFWSELTGIPPAQFGKPYRAVPDPSIRTSKHPRGCPAVAYACSRTHREVMGLVHALLSCAVPSGVAQLAEQSAVNRKVCGFDPHPRSHLDLGL
jgi:transcriptional regulator with XRE-family HTH domain